jgi:toxin ParE1/3/4
MTVIWRDEATRNLEQLYAFTATYSEVAARNLINRLVVRADALGDFPDLGRVVPELENPDLRELIESPYRIIYRVLRSEVEILTVFHGARSGFPDLF